jgi:Zn-dependent M32 family carboxypeptidase
MFIGVMAVSAIFSTYSIGSLYAAQMYAAILKETPSLNEQIETGNHQPLLDWLQQTYLSLWALLYIGRAV